MIKTRVHKNLHRGDWSVTQRGKVIDHAKQVVLADVRFVVKENARQRVIAKRCREVHAWAVGEIAESYPVDAERVPVTYNPFSAATFTRRDNGAAVESCAYVHFMVAEGAVAIGECK